MRKQKETHNKEATIGTLIIYLLLFVFLFVLGFSRCAQEEIENLDESGVAVSLGEDNYGGPEEVPVQTETTQKNQESISSEETPTLNQDAEAPEVQQTIPRPKSSTDVPNKPAEKQVPEQPKERKPDQKSLFNAPKNGSGFGKGVNAGNEGQKNGQKNGRPDNMGQENAGNSSGRYTLAGRKPKYIEEPKTSLSYDCKVVVEVKVDPSGNVLKAFAILKGTSCTTPSLLKAAEKAALKWKFSKRTDSNNNQFGTITFKYKRG